MSRSKYLAAIFWLVGLTGPGIEASTVRGSAASGGVAASSPGGQGRTAASSAPASGNPAQTRPTGVNLAPIAQSVPATTVSAQGSVSQPRPATSGSATTATASTAQTSVSGVPVSINGVQVSQAPAGQLSRPAQPSGGGAIAQAAPTTPPIQAPAIPQPRPATAQLVTTAAAQVKSPQSGENPSDSKVVFAKGKVKVSLYDGSYTRLESDIIDLKQKDGKIFVGEPGMLWTHATGQGATIKLNLPGRGIDLTGDFTNYFSPSEKATEKKEYIGIANDLLPVSSLVDLYTEVLFRPEKPLWTVTVSNYESAVASSINAGISLLRRSLSNLATIEQPQAQATAALSEWHGITFQVKDGSTKVGTVNLTIDYTNQYHTNSPALKEKLEELKEKKANKELISSENTEEEKKSIKKLVREILELLHKEALGELGDQVGKKLIELKVIDQ